jgi:hypothetical protein
MDGRLDDDAWQHATSTTAFTQKFPNEGAAPSERTSMKVLYDDDALYVAFDVEQTSVPVVARLARRDREVESDFVSVSIDSRAQGKSAFEFAVNAAGVLRDGIRSNDGERYSADWDDTWEARTTVHPGGWSAELRIPLRVLRFSSSNIQNWGFQARRYTSMRQETDEWSLVPRDVASEVSFYGRLEHLDVRPHAELELRPFAVGLLRRRDATPITLDSGYSPSASIGLDLRWHLTPDVTLDGTILPDFNQVEGDEQYLNLSNFESFFPEKRPLFVEGASIFESPAPLFFAKPFQLLYTRRIGRRPGAPALRPFGHETLVALPETSPLLGASKLVGRVGRNWSFGALSAWTGSNSVAVQDAEGVRRTQFVDPTTTYHALRVKHDFDGGRAHVGVLATAVARSERTATYPKYDTPAGRVAMCADGAELRPGARCTHDAYVASVDGMWRSHNGEILLSAQAVASRIEHGPPRNLRDGTVISSGDAGYGAQVIATREGGSGLAWNAQYQTSSRKLDFNDLGFMERQNQHFYYGNFEYRTFKPLGPTLETKTWIEVAGRHNLDFVKVSRRWLVDTFVRYKNSWSSYLELNLDEVKFDDREIGNGVPFERPWKPGIVLQASSDRRRSAFVEASFAAQKYPTDGSVEGTVRGVFRAHPQVEFEVAPSFSYAAGEMRFATFGADGQPLFGDLHATSVATTARASVTITPRLSLQTFGQVFLAKGHYADMRTPSALAANDSRDRIRLADLVPSGPPAESPDFLDVSLNVNVVLRWEYSPGSIVYLVGNRAQTPAVPAAMDAAAPLSLGPLSRAPAVDTLLLKWQLFANL